MTPGPANSKTADPPPKEHVALKIEEEEVEEIEVQEPSMVNSNNNKGGSGSDGDGGGGKGGGSGGGNSADAPSLDNYDNDFLHRVVEDAGRWAYGTVLVEVWVLNSDKTHLFRPNDGWWIDPYFHRDCSPACGWCRLTDNSREDYMDAVPLPPGVGLPGALWSEVQRGNMANNNRRTSTISGRTTTEGSTSPTRGSDGRISRRDNQQDTTGTTAGGTFGDVTIQRQVTWRQIKPLANDPDQPWNPRLQFLANECGLEWAAGVPFVMGGKQGLVIYMARQNAEFMKLSSAVNELYLTRATLLIGSAVSLRDYRHAQVQVRKSELDSALVRVRNKLLAMKRLGISLDGLINSPTAVQQQMNDMMQKQDGSGKKPTAAAAAGMTSMMMEDEKKRNWLLITMKKCLGGNVHPPPRFTWEQTVWTLISAFTTLLILTRIHVRLVEEFGPAHGIILGPFGALMTLQYGLTAAPASQPRNAIVGQAVSLVIAQLIGTRTEMEVWLKQSVATSLAIAVMAKLGVVHPPAGAGALLFAAGRFTWTQVAMMLMGNCVAILCSTVFNNMNDKRQYPTFWGLGYLNRLMTCDNGKNVDKSKKEKFK